MQIWNNSPEQGNFMLEIHTLFFIRSRQKVIQLS